MSIENIQRRKILFKILLFTRFLTLSPSYNRLRKKLTHLYKWKFYHLIFTTLMCYLYYLALAIPSLSKDPYSDYLLDITSTFIIRLMVLITMLGLILTATKKWEEMLTYIVEIEEDLLNYSSFLGKQLKNRTIFWGYFKKCFLFVHILIGEAIFPRENYGQWLILRGIALFEANILIILIDDIASIIDADFELLNQVLIYDYIKSHQIIKETKEISKKDFPIEINKITKIYTKLYKSIDIFNELFGWEIVLLYILTVMSSLPALQKIISLELSNRRTFADMILSFWRITPCMFITKTCHHAMKKGEKFGSLIFEISNKLPRSSDYELIRDDIKFLREMYNEFRSEFSAAGVFSIDYSVYYALFTLIMSYLAILMQFKSADTSSK